MSDHQKLADNCVDNVSKSGKRKQHLRRNKGDRPTTGRRTLKQAFRDYRAKRKSAGSPIEGHYSIRRWKNRSRKVVKNLEETREETSRPILTPKIHYREQASTESLVLEAPEPIPGLSEPRFVPVLFDQGVAGTSRSKSAPVNSLEAHIELSNFQFTSLPREFPASQAEPGLFQIQVTDVTTTSISRTASTVSTKITTEPKPETSSAGSGVMKRLGASFSSFFNFAIPKKVPSQHIHDSSQNLSIGKTFTSPRGSIDYVDYSIYGNHAKYFI
ncbi:hypothetical protein HG537_0D06290 [Torulaspora globosa]|uniref:Uncharacterized protein n=1 Tax=Torulaspora globosa TaxID=48254 RepID=A0A7H9HSC0_9SACH|nr:hypothetical protein HG537_0D06290 [Torulaspora sp. CBS 2947]